jgi:Zn-dependent peptidase ImmA (M78 family)/transcriptional regulator with XRE-family HTH domain
MLTQTVFAQRLKKAREDRSFSQQKVADALGIPRTAVVLIEKGERSVSTIELSRIADLFKMPISSFFEASEDRPALDDNAIFAKLRGTLPIANPAVEREVRHHLSLCRLGVELEKQIGLLRRLELPSYERPDPGNKVEAAIQGEQIADQERRRLNLGDAPLLNLVDLITNQGIWVAGVDFPDFISGMILRTAEIGTVILINGSQSLERKRFSLAHEYAHALLDRDESQRFTTTENRPLLSEARANGFAAAFLMPASGVRHFLSQRGKGSQIREHSVIIDETGEGATEADLRRPSGSQTITYRDAAHLALFFGVSYPSAVYRLNALGFINKQERQDLLDAESMRKDYQRLLKLCDEDQDKKIAHAEELITQVAYLAIEAYRREKLSEGRLGEIAKALGLSKSSFLLVARQAAHKSSGLALQE